MKESNSFNQEELIRHGKEMIADGLGSTFVYKWVRDRVEDSEIRSSIIEKIHDIEGNKSSIPKDEQTIIKERKLRQGKYVFEDYLESIEKTTIIGKVCLLFGVAYLISTLIFGGPSLPHSLISIISGLILLLLPKKVSYQNSSIVALIAGIYLISILIEFVLFGLPGVLIPGLGEFSDLKIIHVVTLFNDFSPIIYTLVKVFLSGLLFNVIYMNGKVKLLPKNIKIELNIKDI